MELREFTNKHCGQFALLGIQFNWTRECTSALQRCRQHKNVMGETNKRQLVILSDLSKWCLEDIPTKMQRKKIETMVTIQVHQRDVFAE